MKVVFRFSAFAALLILAVPAQAGELDNFVNQIVGPDRSIGTIQLGQDGKLISVKPSANIQALQQRPQDRAANMVNRAVGAASNEAQERIRWNNDNPVGSAAANAAADAAANMANSAMTGAYGNSGAAECEHPVIRGQVDYGYCVVGNSIVDARDVAAQRQQQQALRNQQLQQRVSEYQQEGLDVARRMKTINPAAGEMPAGIPRRYRNR